MVSCGVFCCLFLQCANECWFPSERLPEISLCHRSTIAGSSSKGLKRVYQVGSMDCLYYEKWNPSGKREGCYN